jgi:hypothetical protein
LRWFPPEIFDGKALPRCEGLEFDVFKRDTAGQKKARHRNGVRLHHFAEENHKGLGLSTERGTKIQARTFHEVHRVGPDGKVVFDMVAELTQHRELPVDPANPRAGTFTFLGGTTIIVDQEGQVRYSIRKRLGDARGDRKNQRLAQQRAYQMDRAASFGMAAYTDERAMPAGLTDPMNFKLIHRGY